MVINFLLYLNKINLISIYVETKLNWSTSLTRAGQTIHYCPKPSYPAHLKPKRAVKTGWTGQNSWFEMVNTGSVRFQFLGPTEPAAARPNIYIIMIN